jgi:AAA domain
MGVIKVIRGKQFGAVRGTIHGIEGVGKSTLAAQFPNPVVLDTEDGTRHLDVARVQITDWKTLTLAVAELTVDSQGFSTVVIDSVDWAERMLIERMLKDSGKKSIEDYGFGKGYVLLQEHFSRFLADCDRLIAAGVNVVLVAHTAVRRTSPPDMTEGFDRFELKLTKQVAPIVKEWADLLLFCNYRTRVVEGSDGRMKARGGKERVMYAERSAAWDAKNRFGLPEEMPMGIEPLSAIFGHAAKRADAQPAAAVEPAQPLVDQVMDYIGTAKDLRTLGKIGDRVDVLSSEGQLSDAERQQLEQAIAARHSVIEPEAANA